MLTQQHPAKDTTESLYWLDTTPKKLSTDSSWDEILSELYAIQAELSKINNEQVKPRNDWNTIRES